MPSGFTMDNLRNAQGNDVLDSEGNKVGKLQNIYYDLDSGEPEWIGVESGMINKSSHLVPIEGASYQEEQIVVAFPKERIEDTPEIDDEQISPETESQLYRIYGLSQPTTGRSDLQGDALDRDETAQGYAAMPAGEPRGTTGTSGEEGITLHEEQAEIGKRRVSGGKARLHKWVETDTVQRDVALERERAEVHREPINEAAPGASLGEETVEVDLEREEPIVNKQTMATERVSLDKESDINEQSVSAEVARERADVETSDTDRPAVGGGGRQQADRNRADIESERGSPDMDVPDEDPHDRGEYRAGF